MARSQRRELRSRLATVIEHPLTLEYSSAVGLRSGWVETVSRERRDIRLLLEDSPSLEGEVPRLVERDMQPTAKDVAKTLKTYGEANQAVLTKLVGARYDADQVLGDWFPDRPNLDSPSP